MKLYQNTKKSKLCGLFFFKNNDYWSTWVLYIRVQSWLLMYMVTAHMCTINHMNTHLHEYCVYLYSTIIFTHLRGCTCRVVWLLMYMDNLCTCRIVWFCTWYCCVLVELYDYVHGYCMYVCIEDLQWWCSVSLPAKTWGLGSIPSCDWVICVPWVQLWVLPSLVWCENNFLGIDLKEDWSPLYAMLDYMVEFLCTLTFA